MIAYMFVCLLSCFLTKKKEFADIVPLLHQRALHAISSSMFHLLSFEVQVQLVAALSKLNCILRDQVSSSSCRGILHRILPQLAIRK